MPKTSIQRRLIIAVMVSQLLLAMGLVGVAVYFDWRQSRQAFDNALEGHAMNIVALVRYSEDPQPKLLFERDMVPPPLEGKHPDLYQVSGEGGMIAHSSNWPQTLTSIDHEAGRYLEFVLDGVHYRGIRMERVPVVDREPDLPNDAVLSVTYAASTEEMRQSIWRVAIYTAVGSGLLLLITVALAVWGLRRSLRPLADLAAGAATISTANWELNPTTAALNTTELAPLAEAMTAMLGGLQQAFAQQREFLANAAHELKTPVAILKSTLQSLLQRPRASEEYRAGLERALEDMDRLEKLLHMMLRLARAEQGAGDHAGRDLEVVNLVSSCQTAVELLDPLLNERDVSVDFTPNGALPVRADADNLRLVWSNLLENAVRVSPKGGRVQLIARSDGVRGWVEVEDCGPGIPASELPRIFQRFYRGDNSRTRETGGYGLGLAISKALIEAYGGTITAESSPGRGTRMIVEMPLTSGVSTR